jgi:diguanylate cyclase (GGDEF)-like protein
MAEKSDITAQKKAEQRVLKLTYYDSLTRLPNRNHFIDLATDLSNRSNGQAEPFAVLFIDLNRFKVINDSYGHLAGDQALKIVAKRFRFLLPRDDFIARIGGDEFVIIHKSATDKSTGELARKLASAFLQAIVIEGHDNYLGASIGAAIWPKDGHNLRHVLSRADLAMYNAKYSGQDFILFGDALDSKYLRELKLKQKLAQAVKDELLYLAYQPKIDIKSGKIVGLEALLRWDDPELGSISPTEFIPITEKHKMMHVVGQYVLSSACKQINEWKQLGYPCTGRLAINISVQQIEHPYFSQQLLTMLNDAIYLHLNLNWK